MDLFKTTMTANDPSRETRVERKQVSWCKGLSLNEILGPKSLIIRQRISELHRNKIVDADTRVKLSEKTKEISRLNPKLRKGKRKQDQGRALPLMTPNGLFPSRTAVAKAAGRDPQTIKKWIERWPEHYYYIDTHIQCRPQMKPIMTPYGRFPSKADVARAAKVDPTTVSNWMKRWPEHYYYIKDAK